VQQQSSSQISAASTCHAQDRAGTYTAAKQMARTPPLGTRVVPTSTVLGSHPRSMAGLHQAPGSLPAPQACTARHYSSCSGGTRSEAATAAAADVSSSEGVLSAHHVDVADTLKLADCIKRFRSRGHLVSRLDPLQRTPCGPWLGPIGDPYTRWGVACCIGCMA